MGRAEKKTIECKYCGKSITYMQYKGITEKQYCNKKCYSLSKNKYKSRQCNVLKWNPHHDYKTRGYDFAYLIDLDDVLTDEEKVSMSDMCALHNECTTMHIQIYHFKNKFNLKTDEVPDMYFFKKKE
jgi:hypothetical protein